MGNYIFNYKELRRCSVSKVEKLPHIIEILHPDGSALYVEKGGTVVLVTPEFEQFELDMEADLTLVYKELEKRCVELENLTHAK